MAEDTTVHGMFLPRRYFVTSGIGEDPNSDLNAFDRALLRAGITQCNLVPVSSILPPDALRIDPVEITPGTITFCVMAEMRGVKGDRIGAGVGWGKLVGKDGASYGIVAEHHGNSSKAYIQKILKEKMEQMARIRGMKLVDWDTRVESFEVKDNFGCALAAVVYVPWIPEAGMRSTDEFLTANSKRAKSRRKGVAGTE